MLNPLGARVAWFAGFTVLLLAVNAGLLRELYLSGLNNATASHHVAIPFVTLALLYQDRHRIFAKWEWGRSIDLLMAVAGIAILLAARASVVGADSLSLAMTGLTLAWIGGFLVFFGRTATASAVFPLAFLVFTIPIPAPVIDSMTRVLKSGSTEVTAVLFALTRTPFYREGFVFNLPKFAIEVADECSGIRSGIALLLTSLLAGHVLLKAWWAKVLLVLVVLPVTVFKNGVRIVSLCLLAKNVDPEFLTGQLHHEGGIVFFLLALLFMAPVLFALRKFEDVRQPAVSSIPS